MKRRQTETNATGAAIDPRDKNFLTETEMHRFLEAARRGRHGVRDHLLMLLAYRHGLRVSELVDVRMKDLAWERARLFVRRKKGSLSTISHWKAMSCVRSALICGSGSNAGMPARPIFS